jgi:hypothetical protein
MSPTEDEEVAGWSSERVQQELFWESLASGNGEYLYHHSGLDAPPNSIVPFQHRAHIIASAKLTRREMAPRIANGHTYAGAMYFDVTSIKTFTPLGADEVRSVWTNFKGFSQARTDLRPAEKYENLAALFKNVRTPRLPAEAAEDDLAASYHSDGVDRREIVQRQIKERRGQQSFRNSLREVYSDCCMITGCTVLDVLEAAHICPYRGTQDNAVENGLLLRADIHTLFDLELLSINPDNLCVEVHPRIAKEYGYLSGNELRCTSERRPSPRALQDHYERFGKSTGAN